MATTPDADLHEQYETQFDREHGAQLVQARIDADITAKLRAWRDAAGETDPII